MQVLEDQDERFSAADPRQGAGEELEDLDPVLGLLLSRAAAARVSPGTRRPTQLRDLGELGEESDQLAGEVREVGALRRRGAGRIPRRGNSPG